MKLFLCVLVLCFSVACNSRELDASEQNPHAEEGHCQPIVKGTADGSYLQIDASKCAINIKSFMKFLKHTKMDSNVRGISIVGPIGRDNLDEIRKAWIHVCSQEYGVGVKVESNRFLKEYENYHLITALKMLLSKKLGGAVSVDIDNFYPLLNTQEEASPECDSVLYPPVIWVTKNSD